LGAGSVDFFGAGLPDLAFAVEGLFAFAGAAWGAGFAGALPAVALAEAGFVTGLFGFAGAAWGAGFAGALPAVALAKAGFTTLAFAVGFTVFLSTAPPPARTGFLVAGLVAFPGFALAAGFAGLDFLGAGRAGAFFALVAAFFTGLDCFLDIGSKRAHRARGKVTKRASLPSPC
jgi:hypothetical protein